VRIAGVQAEWRLRESERAGAEHLDPAYVAAFDRKSPSDWSSTIEALSELGVGSDSTVVDLGAGTGSFPLAVAPHVGRVIAVDPSPAMVTHMRASGLEAVEAGFLTYDHAGPPVDLVHSRNALHHLPDFWKAIALGRAAEILKLGGALMLEDIVYSFALADAASAFDQWLDGAPEDSSQGWTAGELAEHIRSEHSTFSWILEGILDRTGFDIVTRWYSESQIYAAYTCRLR